MLKINYQFKDNYLNRLKTSDDLDDLVSWPQIIFSFEDDQGEKLEFEPDICLWWLDTITGALENDDFNDRFNDITGYSYELELIDGQLIIRDNDEIIFSTSVLREEFLHLLIKTAKKIQKEIELINPDVKKEKMWQSYYFVNHYNEKDI